MSLSPDERPLLICRLDCPPALQQELDDWSPIHFDDFGRHDAVLAASSFRILRDYDPDTGLPAPFNGQATRFIPYVCTDIPAMHAWIGSPIVTGGLDEPTLARESKYPALDEEPFNGTMMTVARVEGRLGTDMGPTAGSISERFEVPPHLRTEFDAWLDEQFSGYLALDGWARVRILHGDRSAPASFPWNRYLGKGDRMLWCELKEGVDPKAIIRSEAYRDLLAASTRWDARLPYVTRDASVGFIRRDLSGIPAA